MTLPPGSPAGGEPSEGSAAAAQKRVSNNIDARLQQLMRRSEAGADGGAYDSRLHTTAVLQEAEALSHRLAEMQVGCLGAASAAG